VKTYPYDEENPFPRSKPFEYPALPPLREPYPPPYDMMLMALSPKAHWAEEGERSSGVENASGAVCWRCRPRMRNTYFL